MLEYGSYPQSKVTDDILIAELNSRVPAWENWISYNYCIGDGSEGSAQPGDWIRYYDVEHNNKKYRAVKFLKYIPGHTDAEEPDESIAGQAENGYTVNNIYWFEFQPLIWRVLDIDTGLIMCENIIDSHPFSFKTYQNGTYTDGFITLYNDEACTTYSSDYATSSIRQWLNNDFYNIAFNNSKNGDILETVLDNSSPKNSKYNSTTTTDKVFLLSYNDIINRSYGFSSSSSSYDTARKGKRTDYATVLGVDEYSGYSPWGLRSAYNANSYCQVASDGKADYWGSGTTNYEGVRPAICIRSFDLGKALSISSIDTKDNKNQKITITPKDASGSWLDSTASMKDFLNNAFESITGVKITSAVGESIFDGSLTVMKNDVKDQDIVLSHDGYYDYIIPKEVISTWSTSNGTAYKFDALMVKKKLDNKPYVSTVFGRESKSAGTDYFEIRSSTLDVNELYKYDIIISAGNTGSNTTYYISQDNKNPISNSTGIFSSIDIAKNFASGKSIYAYIISNGVVSDPVKLNIEIAASLPVNIGNALRNSTLSFLGPNSQGIKVADSVPILGGSTISMDMFTFPIGVDVTGSRVRISLGFDAFSYESGGTVGGKQKKETEWMNLKKHVKGISDNLKGSKDAWKDYKKLVGNKVTKDRLKSKVGFNVGVLGYIELDVSNGVSVTDIFASINGEFSFSLTQQFAAWVVPLYVSATAKANLGVETQQAKVIDDPNLPLQFNLTLLIEPSLKLSGGVGVKKAVSVGIYGKGSLPFENNFATKYRKFAVKGEAGLEAEFFLLSTEISLIDGEFVVYDGYYGQSTYRLLRSFEDDHINKSTSQIQTNVSVISRDYADDTSEWLGEYPISLYSLADNGVTFNVLQTSIFDQTNPQLVSFGDNVMMVWVQDDASRDTYNRMRLVYSLYDAENDSWSEPKAVYDDGHNDAYPSLATDGENVYVAWQKIDKTVTADDATSIDVFLENSEIFVAKYDATNDCFVNATKLTDNEVYDYMPSVVVNNGNAVAYYATNSDNNLMGTDNNTLHRHEIGETAEVLANNQSYIISATPEIVNGTEKLSYSIDTDGDMSTSNDITVYTISNGATTSFGKDENEVSYTFADYSMLDGTETLFVSDMNNIYYEQDGETKSVFSSSRLIEGNISFIEQETGLSILWTENNEVGGNEFWTTSYEDGAWTEPVKISNIGAFKVSKVDVAMLGGKLVGVCNMNEMTLDEESGTYTEGDANLCSFTANEFTDISLDIYMVDESKIIPGETSSIDVYVNNVGTTDVTSIEFLLSDTLGTNTTVTKEVNIKSGATELVTLDYLVPENYAATTLAVSASIPDVEESDTEDNTESIEIGKGDLSIVESELVNFGDNYILKAVVENNSSVDADGVVISAIFNDSEEEPFEQSEIGTLAKEQYVDYELAFNKELVEFDENGVGKLFVKVTSSSDESADGDNQICVAVTLPQETECAHPLTETIEAKKSTCTEVGYDEYTVCNGCNEKITEYVEYPMIDHEDEDRDNLCDSCGKTMNDISVGVKKRVSVSAGEIVYLKFVPSVTGEYTFASDSDDDTYGYLFDGNKEQITCDDDGGSDENFSVTYKLTAGETYYWGASFYDEDESGSFDVMLTMKESCRHEDTETDDGTSATCTSKGYTAGTYCPDCDTWISGHEEIAATNHANAVNKEAVKATCTKNGYTAGVYCADCQTWISGHEVIKAHHTNIVTDAAVSATCTSEGKTKGSHCSVCGDVIVAQTTIPAKGHNWSKWTTEKPATCKETGSQKRVCSVCKTVDTKTIAKTTTHSYKTTTTKATLTKSGSIVTKCTVCGKVSKTTTIAYPKTISLSATSFTYTGKAIKPTVTV
ncbi:MAG: DUF6273 domain-containing protein, partial [Acutalibacteraceae bacterium]